MSTLEMTLGTSVSILIVVVAVFFIWRQQLVLRNLRNETQTPAEQRRFLIRQGVRRTFGCCLLIVIAAMVFVSLFLDYDPLRKPMNELAKAEQDAAKDSLRFLSIYVMTLLLLLLAVMALAILDLWATARHGLWQKKQLLQEHQEALEAELMELRHRRAEMN